MPWSGIKDPKSPETMSRQSKPSFTLPHHPHPSADYAKQCRIRLADEGYTVLGVMPPMSPSIGGDLERRYCIHDPNGHHANKDPLTKEGKWRDAIKDKILLAIYPRTPEAAKRLMNTKDLYARLYHGDPAFFLQDLVATHSGSKRKSKFIAPMNVDSKGWGLPHPYILYHNPDRFALHRYLSRLGLTGERVAPELIWYITASLLEAIFHLRGDKGKNACSDPVEHGDINSSTIIIPPTQFTERPTPRVLLAYFEQAKCKSENSETDEQKDHPNTTHDSASDLRQIAVTFHDLAHDAHLRLHGRSQKRWNWTKIAADGTCKCTPVHQLPQGVPSPEDLEFTEEDDTFNEVLDQLYDSKGVGLRNSDIADLVKLSLKKRDQAIKRQHAERNYRIYGTDLFY